MRRRDKLKQTGVLKTNGSLMNKIFKVYMLLMFVSCVVLLGVFGIRFSSVYNSQARSHMNDVTVAAETGLEERISQIDQLSVSILINNSVQKNLKEINYQTLVNPENTSFQTEKAAISSEIRGSVFNVPGIVSARIFSLDNVEIFNLGTGNGVSVLELINTFEAATGVKIPYAIKPRRAGDIATCYCDASKAAKELGWTAENGIREMCEDSWRWQSNNPNGYED